VLVLEAAPTWAGRRGNVAEIRLESEVPEDPAERWRQGDYDVMEVRQWDELDLLDAEVSVVASLGTNILGIRPQGQLRDPLIRQSIARAVSGGAIEVPIGDRPATEGGLLPPAMPGHQHRLWTGVEDPAELLARAGHAGGTGLRPLRLSARDTLGAQGDAIARRLAEFGIEVEVQTTEHHCQPAEAELWVSSWLADYPDPDGFFRGLIGSDEVNVGADDEIKDLIAKARACQDRDQRLELYGRIDRMLVTDRALVVPLGYKRLAMLRRRWVTDLWATPLMPACLADTVIDPQRKAEMAAASSAAGTA
jgi:ABC-type transport system substrate-binding protein